MRQAAIVLQVNSPQQCIYSVSCNMKSVYLCLSVCIFSCSARGVTAARDVVEQQLLFRQHGVDSNREPNTRTGEPL